MSIADHIVREAACSALSAADKAEYAAELFAEGRRGDGAAMYGEALVKLDEATVLLAQCRNIPEQRIRDLIREYHE